MRLRSQLIIVSLLMLLLPWAGGQFVIDMEKALRQGQILALTATAKAVAARLENDERLLVELGFSPKKTKTLYASALPAAVLVDGYDDEWQDVILQSSQSNRVGLQISHHQHSLYLLLTVIDGDINYHNPSDGLRLASDHIELYLGASQYILRTSAPGNITAYRWLNNGLQRDSTIHGIWLETEQGYRVELQIPLPASDTPFALKVVDQDASDAQYYRFGSLQGSSASVLKYRSHELDRVLNNFAKDGLHIAVADVDAWILGKAGAVRASEAIEGQHGLVTWLYQKVLRERNIPSRALEASTSRMEQAEVVLALSGSAASQWYYRGSVLVGRSVVPLYDDAELRGVIVAEQSTKDILAMTNSAFNRLLRYTFAGVLLAVVVLLSYASWLSLRIRRLSVAAENALADDGNIVTTLPSVNSADELGDLARSYQHLLEQVQEYTQYLRTLSDKLSHELRTPLAVVKSSLDNLACVQDAREQQVYIDRAQAGLARLSAMFSAMSSAKRIEDSFTDAELERIQINDLLQELHRAYQQAYKGTVFTLNCHVETMQIAPDLFVQMLDKLIDNAVDFCREDGVVSIVLQQTQSDIELIVSNDGRLLPSSIQHQLFSSLVSSRQKSAGEQVHLGLGLHIVKLIAQFHYANVSARNRADKSGVEFVVAFPVS